MRPILLATLAPLSFALACTPANAARPASYPQAEAQVLELSKQVIAMRSVRGEGNRTIDVANAFKAALIAGGWADRDIEITPIDDTAYFIATWPGSDPTLGPLVISAHMDVVEARPADWQRDPFTPVVENGYLFGRGSSDTKFDAALALTTLIELRRQGYRPRRPIVIEFSGDEETTMKTARIIAQKLKNAELVLNVDGAGGTLDEVSGKPAYWSWQGAEKTYTDFRLEVTNPGGHSSQPRTANAIVQLAAALGKIGAYHFKPELSPLTKAYFEQSAPFEGDPKLAGAMRAFAANPGDEAAAETLRASPAYIGKIGTTCVPTMMSGGHAENALPQRASANINCRIFPGHHRAEIMAELARVVDAAVVTISDATGDDSVESPASPMRPDFVAATTQAIRKAYPGVPIIPSQASGASDSMWFRSIGVPSYGASPSMIKDSDEFAHGLNERVPLSNIRPGIIYYLSLFTALSK
jgi:acetylornithine deacetylase/succinyl-diaminopimelate desuccinylase-like protein